MGGSHDTKKSLEQVKSDLTQQLINNIRTQLKTDFNITDNTSDLDGLLKTLATSRFKSVYKYDYNDNANIVSPPGSLGGVRSASNLCNIAVPIGGQVITYLRAHVYSKLNLPKWMEDTAINDLASVANTIVAEDTNKQWKYQEYRRTYDARVEDQDNYQCNSVMVYCNGTLIEDGTRAQLAVIYFVGVYYKSTSETKATRDTIQQSAYSGAALLSGGATPTSDETLKNAITSFITPRFKSEFGYDFNDVPPKSLQAQGTGSGLITRNCSNYYIPDTTKADVENFISQQVYSGINLSIDSVRTKAINDTISQYRSILNNASTKSWDTVRLDKTYTPTNPLLNSIRQEGFIVSWYDHKTTDTQTSISVRYIYIMTVFYECDDVENTISRELYIRLCNNLRRHIQGSDTSDIGDLIQLKKFMYDYATQEFQKKFGFEWKANGAEPPNKKPTGKVRAYEEVMQLSTFPATEEEVKLWMDAEVFGRTDKIFPPFAMQAIYDDLVGHMVRYGGEESAKDINVWYPADYVKEYEDPDTNLRRDIRQYAFYLYVLGDMTLDLPGKDGQEGVHIRRVFVYYLGVFNSFIKDDW